MKHPHRKTFHIITMGCPKNLVDSEVLAGILEKQGYVFSDKPQGAGTVTIVNTCCFIKDAEDESVKKIKKISELKKTGKIKALVVAGCLPAKFGRRKLEALFGAADAFLKPGGIPRIAGVLDELYEGKKPRRVDSGPAFIYNEARPRHLLTPGHYVYLKIAEGCSNRCSYCLIPSLRGGLKSRSMDSILEEARQVAGSGKVSEINIIAQDTAAYGADLYGKKSLAALLKKLLREKLSRWLRVMYLHPAHLDDELIELMAGKEAVCKYVDLPLQHINDRLLKLMNRQATKKGIYSLVDKLRKKIKGVCLRTTLMVGFPGETKAEFGELLEFVREAGLDRVGVFKYSRQEGTPAFRLGDPVSGREKQARQRELMLAQQEISGRLNRSFRGRTLEALVDGLDAKKGILLCRTYRDAPEIDGYLVARQAGGKHKPGDFIKVKVTSSGYYDLAGKIV